VNCRSPLLVCSGKSAIEAALHQEPCLKGRSWRNVKGFLRNGFL